MPTSSMIIGVIVVLFLVALVALVIWAIVRHRYVKSLKDKGWHVEARPDISIAYGLNCPPFGVGMRRRVSDQVTGTTSSGVPFSVFEYRWEDEKGRVAVFPLTHPLPEWRSDAGAADPDYDAAVRSVVGTPQHTVVVDGRSLVALEVPAQADEMQAFLEAAAPSARALAAADLRRWQRPEPPAELSFHSTDWRYLPREDSVLEQTTRETDGHSHEAHDVILGGAAQNLPFVAYTHRWKTTHTRTVSDSEGKSRTETYTVDHDEAILEFALAFPFPALSINARGEGERVTFEGAEFNERFQVRSPEPRLAHAIIHPRHMESILSDEFPGFAITEGKMIFNPKLHSAETAGEALEFAQAFFSQVPPFVWKDLGVTEGRAPLPS